MKTGYLNYFSGSEEGTIKKFSRLRDSLFSPLVKVLTFFKVHPDMISLFGLLSMLGFIYFVTSNIYIALLFVVIHIVFDGIDGPLARYRNMASDGGAFTDICVDQIGLVIAILTLMYFSMIVPFWAAFYLATYILMIVFLVVLNYKNSGVKYVIRSKYLFYIMLFVDAYFQTDYMPLFLMIFSIYMVMLSLYLFKKIRCSL